MTETVEVAFAPCGSIAPEVLVVRTKVPVALWASLMVNGRMVPLTVNEPKANIRSRMAALRGTRFMGSVVVHSSELNP